MVHTRRFRSLSFRSLSMAVCALAVPAGALLLGGCGGGSNSLHPRPINPDVTRASITLSDEVYAALGYRRSWTGFAEVGKRAGVLFFRTDDDLIIIQDGASTITALDVSTGARRWRTTISSGLSKFVGNKIDHVFCAVPVSEQITRKVVFWTFFNGIAACPSFKRLFAPPRIVG